MGAGRPTGGCAAALLTPAPPTLAELGAPAPAALAPQPRTPHPKAGGAQSAAGSVPRQPGPGACPCPCRMPPRFPSEQPRALWTPLLDFPPRMGHRPQAILPPTQARVGPPSSPQSPVGLCGPLPIPGPAERMGSPTLPGPGRPLCVLRPPPALAPLPLLLITLFWGVLKLGSKPLPPGTSPGPHKLAPGRSHPEVQLSATHRISG